MGNCGFAGFQRAVSIALLLACAPLAASSLQVSPILLQLGAQQNADGLWLSNTGDAPVHAQVRVFHWTQDGAGDQLEASHGLIISPPMLQLAPGARQLVRVIRSGAPPQDREDAYRVLIDELPVESPAKDANAAPPVAGTKRGLQFVLRYSVPVFLAPSGIEAIAPKLTGRVVRDGEHSLLEVGNEGAMHAQFGNLVYVDAQGKREELTPGLLGYVLAGHTMRWALDATKAPLSAGGRLQSRINGEPVEQTVATVATPP
jgi:fimbrial chaperone protein